MRSSVYASQLGKARASKPWLLGSPRLQEDSQILESGSQPQGSCEQTEPASALLRLKRLNLSRAQPTEQAPASPSTLCLVTRAEQLCES